MCALPAPCASQSPWHRGAGTGGSWGAGERDRGLLSGVKQGVPLSLQDACEGRAQLEHGRLAAGALPGLDPPGIGFPAASSSHRFGGGWGFPRYLEKRTAPHPVPQQPGLRGRV